MKKLLILIVLVLLIAGVGYAVYAYSGWFSENDLPSNLPTAEELERIRAVEESSLQPNPNATPGAGVRPPGSLPKEPVLEATSTGATSTEASTELDLNIETTTTLE